MTDFGSETAILNPLTSSCRFSYAASSLILFRSDSAAGCGVIFFFSPFTGRISYEALKTQARAAWIYAD
jgi:hypothetical protein